MATPMMFRLSACAFRPILFLVVLGVTAVESVSAWAQQAPPPPTNAELERRVRELEAMVQQLLAERPSDPLSPESGTDGARESEPFAGWRDGFYIESADRAFVFRLTGQIQGDYRAFLNDADQTDIDTFLVRRARIGVEATMFRYYEFRLLPDFGQGKALVQDAYMNVHYWDALQFEIGKFKQPFSYEQLIQDRFVPTLERSLIDQLAPARDVGVMIHGQKLFEDRFDYAVALSNGEINGGIGDIDNNEPKDFNGRVAVRPLNGPEFIALVRGLQVGISGGVGVEQEAVNPAILRTPATVPWFRFNAGVVADGVRSRWSPELAYFYGPFGVAWQYLREEQEMRRAASGAGYRFQTRVPFEGFYVLVTYLLTGEDRTIYGPIDPLRPFDPTHPFACPGAWELVFRVSQLELDDDSVFRPGLARLADPAINSDRATELTAGLNWYLNKWFRVQFNYEHDWFAQPVLLGTSAQNRTRHQDSLLTRFQIIF